MKIIHAFGTRACAIKMAPLVRESKKRGHETIVLWSGQHYSSNLYEDLFDDLEIPRPDYDLKAKGTAPEMGAVMLTEGEKVIKKEGPDIVLTHGDTFTAMFMSQAAALALAPVGHVEAGLRTYSWEPYPEQICTKTADACSSLFFAATEKNKHDLLSEHVPEDRLFVTGNTVVDASFQHAEFARKKSRILEKFRFKHPLVFWSCHRKENMLHEERMRGIFDSLLEMEDVNFFCSVLPSTQIIAEKLGYAKKLASKDHIHWVPCLPKYTDAMRIILESDLILTDSGGLQEEASSLHVPCLTLRYVTDRPESVEAGGNKCVGTKADNIIKETMGILENPDVSNKMKRAKNPYGDGKSSERIIKLIEKFEGKLSRWETEIRNKDGT